LPVLSTPRLHHLTTTRIERVRCQAFELRKHPRFAPTQFRRILDGSDYLNSLMDYLINPSIEGRRSIRQR
jgi:hypothetical protein